MRILGKWPLAAAGLFLLIAAAGPADAKPAYGKAEKKPCSFCHVGKTADKVFTEAGEHYRKHHTLAGFGEEAKAPKAPPKPVHKPAPAPAAEAPAPGVAGTAEPSAAPEGARMGKPMEDSGTPPPCGCEWCREHCGKHHGHMHGKGKMSPMMENMKGHLEETKKAVADLRESERKLEAMKEPEAFRAAVLEHLRILDDLQESHLRHMEKMMESRHGGKAEPDHGHSR